MRKTNMGMGVFFGGFGASGLRRIGINYAWGMDVVLPTSRNRSANAVRWPPLRLCAAARSGCLVGRPAQPGGLQLGVYFCPG